MKSTFKKMLALVAIATSSNAAMAMQEVKILHAVNSPSITVRYSKLAAAMADIRLNGRSYSTQKLDANRNAGELQFLVDFAALSEGDNQLEVILLDATGKEIARQESTVKAAKDKDAAVTISNLKGGESLKGLIEIKLGVNQDFREMYVSFFINEQWKALKNYPPYSYLWDTTGYPNGWHEVEAWVVDENNNTYKTRKVRVYVNNPGGRTNRVSPSQPKVVPVTKPEDVKTVSSNATKKTLAVTVPAVSAMNAVNTIVGRPSGFRSIAKPAEGISTEQKAMTPTGKRVVSTAKPVVAQVLPKATTKTAVTNPVAPKTLPKVTAQPVTKPVVTKQVVTKSVVTKSVVTKPVVIAQTTPKTNVAAAAPAMIKVGYGTRVSSSALNYTISYLGKPVQFDVEPRIENGVPLAPFRHLFENAGGKVNWEHAAKRVHALGMGQEVWITIGQDRAKVNGSWISMERKAFIERSRTIVPLSFISSSLNVNVAFDPKTGHVFITNAGK